RACAVGGLVSAGVLRSAERDKPRAGSLSLEGPIQRKSERKAKGSGHLRRGEILDAAERIFVAEGYEGATMRKIAEEVGVSSTALYMHFHDKARIMGEICKRTLEELLARNRELAAAPLDPTAPVR